MKKYRYRVSALQKAIMSTYVEAENEEQAIEIAKKSEDWNFDNYFEDYFDYEEVKKDLMKYLSHDIRSIIKEKEEDE